MPHRPLRRLKVGDWIVEPDIDRISREGAEVKLEPRTMRVLLELVARGGQVATIDELLEAVWPGVSVSQASVYGAIAQLRRALGDSGDEPAYVATVPRKGYRLVATVAPFEGTVPASEVETAASPPPPQLPGEAPVRPARRVVRWVALAVSLAAGVLLAWRALAPAGPETGQAPLVVAVLPFDDLSEDRSAGAFCDGLAEEVINSLAQLPSLRVVARTSSFTLRGHARDVRDIGQRLGATHVVEGSVRRAGGRVRIAAQLIDAREGLHVWSRVFDRPAGDVIALQEELARAVVEGMYGPLERASTNAPGSPPTATSLRTGSGDAGAYELYLLARHLQLRQELDQAATGYREALARDPGFALAWAALADTHLATFYYSGRSLPEIEGAVLAAAEKALAIDPRLPEAYAARGMLEAERHDLDAAAEDLRRAIALNPSYADAFVRLGTTLEYAGKPREALDAFRRASELDPLHPQLQVRRCLALQNLGRHAEAEEACSRAVQLGARPPNATWAGALLDLARGDLAGAVGGYREALEQAPDRPDLLCQLGQLYLDLGLLDEARVVYDRAYQRSRNERVLIHLERARWVVSAHDPAALRAYLAATPDGPAESETLVDAAYLRLMAGDLPGAAALAARARAAPDHDPRRLRSVWQVRWARSPLLSLALVEGASGRRGERDALLAELDGFLDTLESNGQVWSGVHYLRAGVRALQGRSEEALRSLAAAVDLGWRRAWWARRDPALEGLRGSQAFEAVLARAERLAGEARASLETAGSATKAPAGK